MRQGVFRMNPEDAGSAEQQGSLCTEAALKEKCLTQYVPGVERKQKCLSNLAWGNLFIAANVSPIAIRHNYAIASLKHKSWV